MTRRILPVALAMLLAVTAFVAARFVLGDTNQILLAVPPGESARFGADVKLPDCSCEWRLELVIRIGDVSERIVIQDGDRPFRSASTPAPLGSDIDPEVTIGQPSSATSASDVPLSDTDLRDYPLVADRGGPPLCR